MRDSSNMKFNTLSEAEFEPLLQLLQGGDPEVIARHFGITKKELFQMRDDLLARVEALQAYLEANPIVTDSFSLVDVLKRMNRVFRGGDPAFHRLPATREEVAQYLLLYSMTGEEEDLSRYVDDDHRTAVLASRLKTVSSAKMDRFLEEVKEHIRTEFPGLRIRVTGISVLATESIDAIVRGQIQSLALALVHQGRSDQAVGQYREAIRLNPGDPGPYNNLAWIRATHPDPGVRDGAEAVVADTPVLAVGVDSFGEVRL